MTNSLPVNANITPVKKERHVILDENIAFALSKEALKIYLAFRYETDYSKDCSSINKKIKFFSNKAGIGRTKTFECLNELEQQGLIKREPQAGEQTKFWIADKLNYFNPKESELPKSTDAELPANESPQGLTVEIDQPVRHADDPVRHTDDPVRHADTIISNSFSILSKDPLVDFQSTKYVDDPLFMQFYSIYPNKQKPEIARKAFYKHKPTQEFVSMLCTDVYKRVENNWKHRHKNKIPFPATYLNGMEWQGEIVEPETNLVKLPVKSQPKYDDNDTSWIDEVRV